MTASDDVELRKSMDKLRDAMDNLAREFVRRGEYDSDQRGVGARIADVAKDVHSIETRLEKAEDARHADKRLLVGAFLAPVVLLVVQLYLQQQGVA